MAKMKRSARKSTNRFSGRCGLQNSKQLKQLPPSTDYATQCIIGRQLAAHYVSTVQHQGPGGAVGLQHIAAETNYDAEAFQGLWVGFFSALEEFIAAGTRGVDPYKFVEDRSVDLALEIAERERRDAIESVRLTYLDPCIYVTEEDAAIGPAAS